MVNAGPAVFISTSGPNPIMVQVICLTYAGIAYVYMNNVLTIHRPSPFFCHFNPNFEQPLPFQPGTSFGAIPMGTVQPGSGLSEGSLGPGLLPRNIDIRIHTGVILISGLNFLDAF